MNETRYWEKVKEVLGGRGGNEVPIEVGIRRKRMNRVRVSDDFLECLSDGPKSKWRIVKKDDVLWYAGKAIDAAKKGEGFPIANRKRNNGDKDEPNRCGSIVCAILTRTGDFKYEPGQVLRYTGQ